MTSASDEPPGPGARRLEIAAGAAVTLALIAGALVLANRLWPSPFSPAETEILRSLAFAARSPAPPPDPSNRFADEPRAARLGARLFRDTRLSADGRVSCASCHKPERALTDGEPLARAARLGRRNTPSLVAAAHGTAYFWDGRRDSQWAQALVPLEGSAEHAGSRALVAHVVARHHRAEYEAVFGALPDAVASKDGAGARLPLAASPIGSQAERVAWKGMTDEQRDATDRVFANVGKALAAYQRRLRLAPARFDRYVGELLRDNRLLARRFLSDEEIAGLKVFIGRGECTLCHRGPLFTSHEFFSLGLPYGLPGPDPGRGGALNEIRDDPFNCLGAHSDAKDERDCPELVFLSKDRLGLLTAFKTPSLRNVARTAPYMHAGQFQTLSGVIDHYSRAPPVLFPEHTDIRPRRLSPADQTALVSFLRTLTSTIEDTDPT